MQELTLKDLQQVSLELLVDVHEFCVNNNIRYSIAYGTLIGALRHKGFIPWDDDVDLMMPRPDYERFCHSFCSNKFKLIYYGNDKTALAGFARVVDCNKTVYHAVRRQNHHISRNDSLWSITKTMIAPIVSLNGLLPFWLLKKMVKMERVIDFDNALYLGQCSCLDDGPNQFHKEDFENYILLNFEGYKFYAISGYDHHLKQLYGDYMQLPPEDKRIPKQYWIKFYWKDK